MAMFAVEQVNSAMPTIYENFDMVTPRSANSHDQIARCVVKTDANLTKSFAFYFVKETFFPGVSAISPKRRE